jgi:hypothetical protein
MKGTASNHLPPLPSLCALLQLRQVLLDPAVNREFARLRGETEAKARDLKMAQEELQAVQVRAALGGPRVIHARRALLF